MGTPGQMGQEQAKPTLIHTDNEVIADHKLALKVSIVLLAAFMILFQTLPESVHSLIRYDRSAIISGQWWRLFSGHILHLGWVHLALNLTGLGLITGLFWRYWTIKNFLVVFLLSLVAVDIGLWWFATEVRWYVGLSGVLHGLLIAGALFSYREERWYAVSMVAIVVAKLAWEQITRSSAGTAELIGGNVLFDAHLYGFTGGLIGAILLIFILAGKNT